MKKILALILALMMIIAAAGALGEEETPAVTVYGSANEVFSDSVEEGISNTAALEGYLRNGVQADGGNSQSFPRMYAVGTRLTGVEKKLYDLLRPQIVKAAAGKVASTLFSFALSDIVEDVTYSLSELGCTTSSSDPDIADAFCKKALPTQENIRNVMYALMADMPYELYWFDKTIGYSLQYKNFGVYEPETGKWAFWDYDKGEIIVRMIVAKEFSKSNETETYEINTTLSQNITDAAANIKTVLQDNKDKNDYSKMKAYRDWIRGHVEYNHDAAKDDDWPYGNPWQLIWVFDNDSSTKVVCEGYSKAFKYLCDCSKFNGPTSVIIVTGDMSSIPGGSGAHMWNLVTMEDGKRYMTDVTNDFTGSRFLAGYSKSTLLEDGRTAYLYDEYWYVYNDETLGLFDPEELAAASGAAYSGTGNPTNMFAEVWKDPVYTWAEDHSSVTALRESTSNPYATVLETVSAEATSVQQATCIDAEETTFVSEGFMNEAFAAQTVTAETAPALGHNWGETSYTWNEDYSQVTASRTCLRDPGHTETETVSATAEVTTAATCEQMGQTTYTGAAFANTDFEAQEITLTNIPATGHAWGDPEYTWGEDNKTLTAVRVCGNDKTHKETETVNAAGSVTLAPTCTEKGETTWKSGAFANKAFTAQTKKTEIASTGHDWGETVYSWNEDNTKVTATRVCGNNAEHKETETASATSSVTVAPTCETKGERTWTSGAFKNKAFTAQTKKTEIASTGHNWGETVYSWNEDNTKVTATRVCRNNAEHKETETVSATSSVTVAPACETKGERTWISGAFKNKAFTAQTKKTEIASTGHDWGETVYSWNEDNTKVTATRVCRNNAEHKETETVNATASVTVDSTCGGKGERTYTSGAFENKAFTAQTKKTAVDPKGHDWGEATYTWNKDHTQVTASRTCRRDSSHTETETVSATAAVAAAATCEQAGKTTYTGAAFENPAFAAQKITLEDIPAKGHTVVKDAAKAATCTETGLTEGSHCSVCNTILVKQDTVPAKGHTEVKDAAKAATCTETGLTEGSHCSVCNTVLVKQEVIPTKEHTAVKDEAKAATCTETGLTEGSHCSVCNTVLVKQEVIPTKEHTAVKDEAKAATCTETGLTEGSHCSVCNTVLVKQEVIPANGHTEETDPGTAATCTEAGISDGKHCSVCGEILEAQEEIPALGHDWGEGTVTKEATTTQEGQRVYTCSRCEETKTEVIEKVKISAGGTGWVENSDGTWSYGDADGNAVIGPMRDGGTLFCFDEKGVMVTGWAEVNGTWYFAEGTGALITGWKYIGDAWYYFKADGEMATGWLNDGGEWYYLKDSGKMATGWLEEDGYWHYLQGGGAMKTGWAQVDGSWYYFGSDGRMATGWVRDGGTYYYMKSSGAMATGWIEDGGKWYYLQGNGAMKTGWLESGNSWYFLKPGGEMATGWYLDGKSWYYFKDSGAMAEDWQRIGGKWYYFKDGVMQTGWFEDKEAEKKLPAGEKKALWYWFDESGVMATGWKEIKGQWEMFDDSGLWLYTWQGE